ncbi:GNAT family N-acetyltransferase [Enterococcus sp. BWM-S5]|uniref:GNAT family N-acetyltransferase n=1 Tax=Enterococcus larvae TaxID=2794352 RepID=A0ABS4CFL7_9ENTE|nr:GNAT family N-acetyltransferase [Enterococcus larvae]MBP1044785.1 GNAT family N-acetyltransferase [Enterococcus larvae]
MDIQLVPKFSQRDYEAMTLRKQVLNSKIDLKQEEKWTTYVAVENGQVIGTASIQLYSLKFARIRQVAVAPEFQGKRIGNHLLDHCEAYALAQGHSVVLLTGRKNASLFYLKRDYRLLLFPFKKHDINFFWMGKKITEEAYSR